MINISYREGVRGTCFLLTREKLMEMINSQKTAYNIEQLRQLSRMAEEVEDAEEAERLRERAKGYKQLGAMVVWQGYVPEGQMPKNDNVVLNGLYATDWDHVEDAATLAFRIAAQAGMLDLVMVHITPSGDGVRAVGRCQPGLESIEENQRWLSEKFGLQNDPVTCNPGRTWFLPRKEDVMFLDEDFWTKPAKNVPLCGSATKTEEVAPQEKNPSGEMEEAADDTTLSAASLRAFDMIVEKAGLDAGKLDVWGEHNWHNNLMAVLSAGASKLMGKGQLMCVLRERMPNYCRTSDCRELVDYFYEKYGADKGFMSESLRSINAQAQMEDEDAELTEFTDEGYRLTPPPMMPRGVKEFVDAAATDCQKGAAAMIAILAYSILLTHLRCRIKGTSLELVANILCYLWGNSSAGKTSLAKWVLWTILGDREDRSMDTLHGLDNLFMDYWMRMQKKQQAQGGGAKKGIVTIDYPMRLISLDSTSAGLMKHFIDAQGLHSLLFVADHDMLVSNTGMAGWRKVDSDLRTLYDGEWLSKKTATLSGLSGRARALGGCLICGTQVDLNMYYLGKGMQIQKGLGNRTCFLHLKADMMNRQWPRKLTKKELMAVKGIARKALQESVRVNETLDEEGEAIYNVEKLPTRNLSLDWLWDYLTEEFEQKYTREWIIDGREKSVEILARCKETAMRAGMVLYWLWGCQLVGSVKKCLMDATMWVAETMKNGMLELFQTKLDSPDLELKLSIPQQSVWNSTPNVFNLRILQEVLRKHGRKTSPYLVIHRWMKLKTPSTPDGLIAKVGDLYYKCESEEYETKKTAGGT